MSAKLRQTWRFVLWAVIAMAVLVSSSGRTLGDGQCRAHPSDTYSLAHRGGVRQEQRDYEKALADLNDAIRLDSEHAAWYAGRGMVYDRLGEYDRAVGDYDEALRRDPADAQTL